MMRADVLGNSIAQSPTSGGCRRVTLEMRVRKAAMEAAKTL
jgi:hypothetical protein